MKKLFVLVVALVCLSGSSAVLAKPIGATDNPNDASPAASASATDAAKQEVCNGVTAGQPSADCTGTTGESTITRVLSSVLSLLSWVAGIAAIIMIVLAGLKYITSGGDSSSIASAKTTLIYALVGVVVVAMAQILVHFVIKTAKS